MRKEKNEDDGEENKGGKGKGRGTEGERGNSSERRDASCSDPCFNTHGHQIIVSMPRTFLSNVVFRVGKSGGLLVGEFETLQVDMFFNTCNDWMSYSPV